MPDISTLTKRYVELAEFRVAVRAAFDPILDYYQNDEDRPIPEMIAEAVHDLQQDREENRILRRAIQNIVKESADMLATIQCEDENEKGRNRKMDSCCAPVARDNFQLKTKST
jgi:hypothetical protein